jgi:hypothetical protein
MNFTVNNHEQFQTYSAVHCINTQRICNFFIDQLPNFHVYYDGIRIFKLIMQMHENYE